MQLLLASLLAGCFMFGSNMLVPLVPLAASQDRAGAAVVGLVVGAAGLLPLVLALPAGALTDRVGARRVILPSLWLMVVGTALLAVDRSLAALTAAQVLKGLGQFGATLGLQTFVANLPGVRSRNEAFAVFGIANAIGGLGGPVLAGTVADAAGLGAAFTLAAGLTALAALGALGLDRRVAAGTGRAAPGPTLRALGADLGDPVVLTSLATTFAILFADAISGSFYPILLQRAGLPVATIGLLVSLRGLASLVVRPTIGPLTARIDRWYLILAAMAAEAAGTAVVPAAPALGLQVAAALACGAATGYNQPLGMAVVADRVAAERRSTALAVRLGCNRFAGLASPVALGVVADHLGLAACFLAAALPPLLAVAAILRFLRRGGEAAFPPAGAAQPAWAGLGGAGN